MDLSPSRTVTTPVDEKLWLGSRHGTDCPRSITLDIAGDSFADVLVPDTSRVGGWSYIPSGTPVVKSGTTYDLAPALAACDGHLLESVHVNADTTNAGGSLLWHGVVVEAQVPLDGFDASTDGAAANILYV